MGLFDGLNVAEQAMSVHRFRSEVAARNLANVYTPGYQRQVVDLAAGPFNAALASAQDGTGNGGGPSGTSLDSVQGAVRVQSVHADPNRSPDDVRQQALQGVVDMMDAKSAFELNSKAATMIKSMALAALEIGRGG